MTDTQKRRQNDINNFLKVPHESDGVIGFSPFDLDQAEQATDLLAEFMEIANQNEDNFIIKVLDKATEESKTVDPELVRWALMSFVSHHPAARKSKLRIPPLSQRAPEVAAPKRKKAPTNAPGPVLSSPPPTKHEGDVETLLEWIREDPNFNEHHEHWHVVYPATGIPDHEHPKDKNKRVLKDRHGELFVYMHRQMLARLDAERTAIGIPLIKALNNYWDPIPEGYDPHEHHLINEVKGRKVPFGSRQPNLKLSDNKRGIDVAEVEKARKAIEEAIEKGEFYDGTKITPNLLGSTLEASGENFLKKGWREHYGNLHNTGHIMLSSMRAAGDSSAGSSLGVISLPRTAARDPVFWRWHRHIDELQGKWQDTLPPNDFSDAPPVKVRTGDIILAFKDKLPISHGATQDEEAAQFGVKTFGGQNFDKDLSKNEFVTNELQTKMKQRNWKMVEDTGETISIEYLFPREYYYYFRAENTSSNQLSATFRVFLVPEELAKSRRHWIEMDKFEHTLPPKSKTVVCRDCDMSSVVRQPPQKTIDELDDTVTQPGTKETDNEKYCDCGWPFHLLLPRGRKGGMKFKLMLFITDWSKDKVPTLSRCGSVSFCGAENPYDKYPDGRPMGYPFDRPFKNNSYEQTFNNLPNATIRDITINWVDDFPEIKKV